MQQFFRLLNFLIGTDGTDGTDSVSSISTVAPVGSSVGALYQKLYIQTKSAPEDG